MVKPTTMRLRSDIQLEILSTSAASRLLNFPEKSPFQSPILKKNYLSFLQKWQKNKDSFSLKSFFEKESFSFFEEVLQNKQQDFGHFDLFLATGFFKWGANQTAPLLLIPLTIDLKTNVIHLSDLPPIENVFLIKELQKEVQLPKVTDAIFEGRFEFEKFFNLVEVAISDKPHFKFSHLGVCLSFFSSAHLYLYRYLENLDLQNLNNPIVSNLYQDEGFRLKTSVFDQKNIHEAYVPTDHAFVYPTDLNTTKATIDALSPENDTYVILTPPGTLLFETASNIIADSLFYYQKVLVLSKRAGYKDKLFKYLYPKYLKKNLSSRSNIKNQLKEARNELISYYDAVNSTTDSGNISLAQLFKERLLKPTVKHNIPNDAFKGIEKLSFSEYNKTQEILKSLILNLEKLEQKESLGLFSNVSLTEIHDSQKKLLKNSILKNIKLLDYFNPFLKVFSSIRKDFDFKELKTVLKLIHLHFNKDTHSFEDWRLSSSDWDHYRDTILQIPESGSIWARYRRNGSALYTDTAIDENLFAIRNDFVDASKASLKSFSDSYRSLRKKLLSIFKDPKSIANDEELILLVDDLISIQSHRNFYRNSMAMANKLFGKDWKFEKTNWVLLHVKQKFFYALKDSLKESSDLDLIIKILEQFHLLKKLNFDSNVTLNKLYELQQEIANLSQEMQVQDPLENGSIASLSKRLKLWKKNYECLDEQISANKLIHELQDKNLILLVDYLLKHLESYPQLLPALNDYWYQFQIQEFVKKKSDLFKTNSKQRMQKGSDFRVLLDEFCNSNFHFLDENKKTHPENLRILHPLEFHARLELHQELFDLVLILDSEIIASPEALPAISSAKKLILMGDIQNPPLELLEKDGFEEPAVSQKLQVSRQISVLELALQKGAAFRTLCFSKQYKHPAFFQFVNQKFYKSNILQLPPPHIANTSKIFLKASKDSLQNLVDYATKHLKTKPTQSIGIIAFSEKQCTEIKKLLKKEDLKNSLLYESDLERYCFVKTPERAPELYRDTLLVCADDSLEALKNLSDAKIKVTASLAKQELFVFYSKNTALVPPLKNWFEYLQSQNQKSFYTQKQRNGVLLPYIESILKQNTIQYQAGFSYYNASLELCVYNANNDEHFLALIEDDSYHEYFKSSVEELEYIRPITLAQLGWKHIRTWSPSWITSTNDETNHLLATLSIEQSISPIISKDKQAENLKRTEKLMNVVPYVIKIPKIEGTVPQKPILELPLQSIVSQFLFFVNKESPIHIDALKKRLLQLHRVESKDLSVDKVLNNALKQAIKAKVFVKTGFFFYSNQQTEFSLRYRGDLPPDERKLAYVAPEERALASSLDNAKLKDLLGLLE